MMGKKKIIAYKGMNSDMKCRNFQYKINGEYSTDKDIKLCKHGFHACENPLDTFSFYPPDGKNRFFEVEQEGEKETDDKKTVSSKIKINTELSLKDMFSIGFDLIFEKVKNIKPTANTAGDEAHANTAGNYSHANTAGNEAHANTAGDEARANTAGNYSHANTAGNYSYANTAGDDSHANTAGFRAHANTAGNDAHANTAGNYSHANTAGDEAHANTAGFRAHANTAGDRAHANTAGDEAHANTAGDEAIACALGIESRARTKKGWIIIVDWINKNNEWHINNIHKAKVGKKIKGIIIMPDTWYWFEDGKLRYEKIKG